MISLNELIWLNNEIRSSIKLSHRGHLIQNMNEIRNCRRYRQNITNKILPHASDTLVELREFVTLPITKYQ